LKFAEDEMFFGFKTKEKSDLNAAEKLRKVSVYKAIGTR